MPLLLTKRATLFAQQPPKQQTPGVFSMSRTVLEWKSNTPGAADAVTADVASVAGIHKHSFTGCLLFAFSGKDQSSHSCSRAVAACQKQANAEDSSSQYQPRFAV